MANPIIPDITPAEQDSLYSKLNTYNQGRASYKEVGAYLVALPRPDHSQYSLWIYSPLSERQDIFFVRELSADVNESLRLASTLCYYSPRCLILVDYNAKRMQSKGDDIVSFGKYRGHFLHEILLIDPAYLTWIAFKFSPRIPKQVRFVQIAKVYHSAYLDFQKHRTKQHTGSRFLGSQGEKIANLTLTVESVRTEDDPYKTQLRGNTPYFYVRQVLKLKDATGNLVTFKVNARTSSRESGQVPATEHCYEPGEVVHIASAHIARTFATGNSKCTQLTYVRLSPHKEE